MAATADKTQIDLTTVIDVAEWEAAVNDPKVQDLLADAAAYGAALETSGRIHGSGLAAFSA